jgi:hypothetical protein
LLEAPTSAIAERVAAVQIATSRHLVKVTRSRKGTAMNSVLVMSGSRISEAASERTTASRMSMRSARKRTKIAIRAIGTKIFTISGSHSPTASRSRVTLS